MRPEEIDYSDTRKHYFDISNGEVLAGRADRDRYLREAGAQAVRVVELGALLRDPVPSLDIRKSPYALLDSADWPKDRYVEFGKWINQVVDPPAPAERRLNAGVLKKSRYLGIGPSRSAIIRACGSYGSFYADIRAGDAHTIGIFDSWDMNDFVAYVRRVGGDKRPTTEDFRKRNQRDPNSPTRKIMHERFHDIGGYRKILELAGYPIIELWDRDDYVDWGVKFMQANDGLEPTGRMVDYFSLLKRGPSSPSIRKYFTSVPRYQRMVADQYLAVEHEKSLDRHQKADSIIAGISDGSLPPDLFDDATSKAEITVHMDIGDAIRRYAKFLVIGAVAPDMHQDTKLEIATGRAKRSFEASMHKSQGITAAELEYEALVLNVFDDIWPMDSHMSSLRLGDGYTDYCKKRDGVAKMRRRRRAAKPAPVTAQTV